MNTILLPDMLTAANSKDLLRNCKKQLQVGPLCLDGSNLASMDYSADAFFALLAELAEKTGNRLTLSHFNEDIVLEMLGGLGFTLSKETFEVLVLLFMSIYWTVFGPFDKGKIHFGGVTKQMFKSGSEAMGICFLFVGLICLTMALQSSVMLNAVGGGSYLASGLGFLIFAEIGPLLTTIILAGRSGSAMAAEIANMSVCEEVKAIKSMAIPPVQYLVVPRFIALSITTPILSFCSSIVGCLAGFLIAYFFCDISFSNYMMGIRDGIAPITFLKSTVKALVFGWIVTLIACNKGLNAHGGAEAVGKATTASVVSAICTIVIADTLFAFIFY